MADIDQVKDKNHEGDSMTSHGAPKVLRVHKSKTDKKEKGAGSKPRVRCRNDVGWQHGTSIANSSSNIKCNYCHMEYTGGAFRFKHHLAGTHKNVASCRAVPNEVRQQMLDNVGQDNEANEKLMTCICILERLEGIGGGPFTNALKILKEDPLWRDVFLALSDHRKKDFVLNI